LVPISSTLNLETSRASAICLGPSFRQLLVAVGEATGSIVLAPTVPLPPRRRLQTGRKRRFDGGSEAPKRLLLADDFIIEVVPFPPSS
jgi:hypothetical protein